MPNEARPAAAAELQSTHALLRLGAVALVAIIPAAGGAYAAYEALGIFDAMTRYEGAYGNGHGGLATVAAVFAHVNASVLAAVVLGLALTVFLRFARQRSADPSTAIPATPLTLVAACLGGVPAAIVYYAESGALELLTRAGATSVMEATEKLTTLLRAAEVCGLAVALLGVVAAVLARDTRRRIASSTAPWMLASVLLLGLSIVFIARSFALHEAAAAVTAR